MQNENLKRALEILKKAVQNREAVVVEGFVQLGPDELRKALEIEDGERWQEVFDYMVLHKGVIKHCVRKYMDFFYDFMVDRGPLAIRSAFEIEDAKYDAVFEEIFDLVAIGKGALYDHVKKNMHVYVMSVRDGNANSLREELGLAGKRYQRVWEELLDQFMNAVCDSFYSERDVEQGMFLFDALMNSLREHRSLRSNEKMWVFEEAIS
ncbi:hypothetical protein KC725_03425 [Candidatus Peregrinibacteria bacterium]|nr:hypothetical protein [Candidatus Peregrinibacteria bacterium]